MPTAVIEKCYVNGGLHSGVSRTKANSPAPLLEESRLSLSRKHNETNDLIAFYATLPWIGSVTKFHLAKNLGADVAKPDVHLVRLAVSNRETAQGLCERLAKETGYRAATIDLILWRACADGIIHSR